MQNASKKIFRHTDKTARIQLFSLLLVFLAFNYLLNFFFTFSLEILIITIKGNKIIDIHKRGNQVKIQFPLTVLTFVINIYTKNCTSEI